MPRAMATSYVQLPAVSGKDQRRSLRVQATAYYWTGASTGKSRVRWSQLNFSLTSFRRIKESFDMEMAL